MVLARVSIATLNMALLSSLRTALYPHLAVIANEWNACMNIDRRYPAQHADFLKEKDFTGWRVCPDRTTPTRAEPRRGRAVAARRCSCIRRA